MKWLRWLFIGLFVLIVGGFLVLGLLPPPADPFVAPENYGAGALGSVEGATGLAVEFPPIATPADNPSSPAKEHLGYLLFFDPVLSANNDIACATCHHPDLGFADGRAQAMGVGGAGLGPARAGGAQLGRGAPSLWNVAYATSLFWDGRAPDLETQVMTPLTSADEMASDPAQLAAELQSLPDYAPLFEAAFGGGAEVITAENAARALAAFERTLVTHNSPFDRYARGELAALTAGQRRGLALFRSGATGCYGCHAAPTFSDGAFHLTGVLAEDGTLSDVGREAATGLEVDRYFFKTPSLRNIALTSPYMHNGRWDTLEEVVAFYADPTAHGLPEGVARDRRLRGFDLSEQETADLIDFLYTLTDESALPPIPASVPSGLPVAAALDNPARAVVAAHLAQVETGADESRPPQTLRVQAGQSIQAALDTAQSGDTIEIEFGTYHEKVIVDLNDITLRGVPNAEGEWPLLDGEGLLTDAIVGSGSNFTVERLRLANYRANGIVVDGARNVTFRDLHAENVGLYGVYPVHCSGVLVERVEVTNVRDAGIYVGQSTDIVIRDSTAYGNVIGIEVENSVNAEVYGNHMYSNSAGIFISMLPQITSKVSLNTRIYNNVSEDNNQANFAHEGETAALVPSGTGILNLGGDDVEIFDNTIRGNNSAGIAVFSTAAGFDAATLDIGPNPERVRVHGNSFEGNGAAPAATVTDLGLYGADILWDGSSWDVTWDQPGAKSFPPALPGPGWPDIARRAFWRVFSFVVAVAG